MRKYVTVADLADLPLVLFLVLLCNTPIRGEITRSLDNNCLTQDIHYSFFLWYMSLGICFCLFLSSFRVSLTTHKASSVHPLYQKTWTYSNTWTTAISRTEHWDNTIPLFHPLSNTTGTIYFILVSRNGEHTEDKHWVSKRDLDKQIRLVCALVYKYRYCLQQLVAEPGIFIRLVKLISLRSIRLLPLCNAFSL